jgi:C-terminal of Roc, COR, domain/Ras of Complex, Roc, domain of DAPkinase
MALTRAEIEERLQGMPKDKSVAFAVRSAMRVLPVFAKGKSSQLEVFSFWKKSYKEAFLLAVFNAYRVSIGYAINNTVAADHAANAYAAAYNAFTATDIEATDAHAAAEAAVYTAYLAYAILRDNFSVDANVTAAAAHADTTNYTSPEIIQDLSDLPHLSAAELLNKPLWSGTITPEWQQLLSDFKHAALSLDAGYEQRLLGKPIDIDLLQQWNNIPPETEAQGVAAINTYLKNLTEKTATRPLNRVRAIFIGYGEAGKTSLVKVLNGEPVTEGSVDMTAGIDISVWRVPNTDIDAHFWDFGGQVMAHATHQFFLRERCLYVLVLNGRSEINGTEQAEYWLEHVKSFGKNAPVMIVANKADKPRLNVDMGYLKTKYPSIIDLYPLACTQVKGAFKAEFERFFRDFCQHLQCVDTHNMMFTPQQFAVLEALRAYSPQSAFLKQHEFAAICQQQGIGTEGEQNQAWLLDTLDKLGMVIHFPQLPCLEEFVLNPRWLTHGVYTLMYGGKAKLSEADVVERLRDKSISDENGIKLEYPADKCRFIMDAMQEFKLCYPLPNDRKTLIIPELLPTDQPAKIPFNKTGALAFEFVFRGFLPRNIMPELIVNRHEEIVEETVWQRGVLLAHKTDAAQALLQVDYHERVLSIWVTGHDAKDYLYLLNNAVLTIIRRLNLHCEELVELPLSACIKQDAVVQIPEKADYRQLLNSFKNGITNFPAKHNIYDLRKVLGVIMPEGKLAESINVTINGDLVGEKPVNNISIGDGNHIGGSVVAAGKIVNSFNQLSQSKADEDVKQLLADLLKEIEALNAKVPASQHQNLEDMANSAEILVNETKRESARAAWYQLSLTGLKDAAIALKEFGEPVYEMAEKLSQILLV